jgi:1-acyl-sn-glycerol-3-phosphate acyltransferase
MVGHIASKNTPWVVKAFQQVITPVYQRYFDSLRVAGDFSSLNPRWGTLILANHSNWWDGVTDFLLVRHLLPQHRFHIMVDELNRCRLMAYLGAFSVEKHQPVAAIREAMSLIQQDPRNVVWVYPQGEVRPQDIRPLGLAKGVEYLVKHCHPVNVVPVGHYYTFLRGVKPTVLTRIGPMLPSTGLTRVQMEGSLTQLIDTIRNDVVRLQLADYHTLVQGIPNPFEQWERRLRPILPG